MQLPAGLSTIFNESGCPYGGLVQDSSSAPYGVAPFGGANGVGAVYKLDPITGRSGGVTGTGTIYSLDPSSLDVTLLYTSRPHTNGINYAGFDFSGMILSSNGLFYGTANLGGGFGYGTVFSFDPLAPPITRIDHPTAPAGSKNKTIIVFGTGFTANAVVQFNGAALSSSLISSTEVRAVIPASDLTTPGTAQITVNQNGHISNPLTYTIE